MQLLALLPLNGVLHRLGDADVAEDPVVAVAATGAVGAGLLGFALEEGLVERLGAGGARGGGG